MGRRQKRIFVLWSGGLDSTYLVARCLDDPRYERVEAGYVRVRNNRVKCAAEAEAIARLYTHFRDHPRFGFRGVVLDVEVPSANPDLTFQQMPLWLLALVSGLPVPVDEVALGYTSDDRAALHFQHLKTVYAAYEPLMRRGMPRLVFPLGRLRKATIYQRLPSPLRELCITCEVPERGADGFQACGRCRSCERRRREIGA